MQSPALLRRDADTYVVAFSYSTNDRNADGYMSAFNISADGETLTETNINNSSNRWYWEGNDYQQGKWAKVDENTYALIYWDYGNGGSTSLRSISTITRPPFPQKRVAIDSVKVRALLMDTILIS